MQFPFGRTVTIVSGGGTDNYGDPIPGTSVNIEHCAIAPRSSADIDERGRAGVIVGLTVFFPPGTVIGSSDSFLIDDVAWQLDGDIGDWVSPFTGWRPGVEAALKRGAG